jgi:transcriptional regulator with XRE-family HTH domain
MSGEPITAFGVVIKQLRKAHGYSQETLASEASIDRTFLSQMETGRKQPSLLTIFRLAGALKLDVSELLRKVEVELRDK